MAYEEVNADVWKPTKEGDSIEGILIHKEPADKSRQMSARYKIEVHPNVFKLVWGSTILDDRMQVVNVGDKIRITFKGKKKNQKKQDVNIYKVEVDRI